MQEKFAGFDSESDKNRQERGKRREATKHRPPALSKHLAHQRCQVFISTLLLSFFLFVTLGWEKL